MYRQNRSDIAPPWYHLSVAGAIIGLTVAWIGVQYVDSLLVTLSGVVVLIVFVARLYLTRSRPIPELTAGKTMSKEFHSLPEETFKQDIDPAIRGLADAGFNEIEEIMIRPLATGSGEGQVIKLQLNGGRVSNRLVKTLKKIPGELKMRNPESTEDYTLFIVQESSS